MTLDEIKAQQQKGRGECLDKILASPAPKKLIVAGAGTGKTHTFGKLLAAQDGDAKLAMTFIRKLQKEMETALGAGVKVRTFHSFCKGVLHEKSGEIEMVPFLTELIEADAAQLGLNLVDFNGKFQNLQSASPEIAFYVKRAEYYASHGFDHSVYELYQAIKKDPALIGNFTQIVVDEFQDFNALEVAFIEELSKKGPILIVGDDDQAVYDGRNASPDHLRKLYQDAAYAKFELPYCSRCTWVIVAAANAVLKKAVSLGYLVGRITKPYECYLDAKEADSRKYPKIRVARCTTGAIIPKYIEREIAKISAEDIARSHAENYPTVLVIGPGHYLKNVHAHLSKNYQVTYTPSSKMEYGIVEAYDVLVSDKPANLGWRILAELFLPAADFKKALETSLEGNPMVELLPRALVDQYIRAVDLIRLILEGKTTLAKCEVELRAILKADYEKIVVHFFPPEEAPESEADKAKPSILLTSLVGCKGLSAGHVFIVGVSNGSIPGDVGTIRDVEISQFVVALTRTRNECHLVSCDWFIAPVNKKGELQSAASESAFVRWMPAKYLQHEPKHSAKDFVVKKTPAAGKRVGAGALSK